MNLGFVILYVNDMAKSKAFYTETLGLKDWPEHSGPGFTSLRPSSGSTIGLQDKKTAAFPPKDAPNSGSMELSFEVEDVDATYKQWQAKGIEIVSEPVDLPFGRYFMAKDPDGHYLSVYRYK